MNFVKKAATSTKTFAVSHKAEAQVVVWTAITVLATLALWDQLKKDDSLKDQL